MRPITGTDITDFYASRWDLLVLTADGEFDHLDNDAIDAGSYDDRATAYDFVNTVNGTQVQVLLERRTISDGDWFPDALNDDGSLDGDAADQMAEIINSDGILPSRAMKAVEAGKRWEQSERDTNNLAAARAAAVAEVAAYAGSQSAAGRLLGLDQSTVNKLVKKANRTKSFTLISAAPGDIVPGHELADPQCPEVPGLLEHPGVRAFLDLHGYGPDQPDELMYLITDTSQIPDGFPTMTVRI